MTSPWVSDMDQGKLADSEISANMGSAPLEVCQSRPAAPHPRPLSRPAPDRRERGVKNIGGKPILRRLPARWPGPGFLGDVDPVLADPMQLPTLLA